MNQKKGFSLGTVTIFVHKASIPLANVLDWTWYLQPWCHFWLGEVSNHTLSAPLQYNYLSTCCLIRHAWCCYIWIIIPIGLDRTNSIHCQIQISPMNLSLCNIQTMLINHYTCAHLSLGQATLILESSSPLSNPSMDTSPVLLSRTTSRHLIL